MNTTNHNTLNAANPDDWARAEHLLPGYLKKSLSAPDQEWMEQWINQTKAAGGTVGEALASEMEWVRAIQAELSQQTPTFNTQTGWQKLQARLQAESTKGIDTTTRDPKVKPPLALPEQLKQWLTKLARMQKDKALQWWQKPAIAALGSAMLIGQMGFLAASVKQVHNLTTDVTMVTPSSGASRPTQGVVFKVAFKPQASMADMMNALHKVQGRIVGGPGALGLWDVEVPKEMAATAAKTLEQLTSIESVSQE